MTIFRVVALHKSDYIGMNLGIRGWGKEDVDLFDRFLARQDLSIFRACDPGEPGIKLTRLQVSGHNLTFIKLS